MARKNKGKVDKRRKPLDEEKLKELATIQCTNIEIAAIMGVNVDTLHDNYSDLLKTAREAGHSTLRRAQWKKAVEDGNPAMLIWCGKFFLGQKEEINFTGTQTDVRTLLERWEVTAKKKSFHQIRREKEEREKNGTDVLDGLKKPSKNGDQTA